MANVLYTAGIVAIMKGDLDLETADIRALLIDAGSYTFNLAHDFLDDVPGGARVGSAVALTSKAVTADGSFDADDVDFLSVSGSSVEAVILYVHTGVESTSTLLAYIDTATGLPVTPTGDDIRVRWSSGTARIFQFT